MHECSHNSFLPSRTANVVVGHFAALGALQPYYAWKIDHRNHHLWTGHVRKEPATRRGLEMAMGASKRKSTNAFLKAAWKLWLPIFAVNKHVLLWLIPFQKQDNGHINRTALVSALVGLGGYALLALVPGAAHLMVRALPALYLYMLAIEVINLPHHLEAEIYNSRRPIPFWEHDRFTRSMAPFPLDGLLFLHFNYHIEHHFFPSLPWHELPDLHAMVEATEAHPVKLEGDMAWNLRWRRKSAEVLLKKFVDFLQASPTEVDDNKSNPGFQKMSNLPGAII
jgi:acyl-lipid omega-6 desaturase (Delta-12 desaturase)